MGIQLDPETGDITADEKGFHSVTWNEDGSRSHDPQHLYEKCAGCHLFVEPNDSRDDADPMYAATLAEYIHLHRGDDADEALDESHEAKPSGMKAVLATWQAYGPPEMRDRFNHRERRDMPKTTWLAPLAQLRDFDADAWHVIMASGNTSISEDATRMQAEAARLLGSPTLAAQIENNGFYVFAAIRGDRWRLLLPDDSC